MNNEETYSPKEVTGQSFDDLVRNIANGDLGKPKKRASKYHVKSKFTKAEMGGQRVQINIADGDMIYTGIGTLDVTQPNEWMAITVHGDLSMSGNTIKSMALGLTQPLVDRLKRHADPSVAVFQLVFP